MRDRRTESALLAGAGLALVLFALDVFLLRTSQLSALRALLPYPVLTGLVCILTWFRARLVRLEDIERQDRAAEDEERVSTSLFSGDEELAPFTAGRARAQFERFAVPLFAPGLAVIEGVWAWRLYRAAQALALPEPERLLLVSALLGGQAFLAFLFSRFLLGLARNPEFRLLRGAGVMLGLTCLASALAAVAAILGDRVSVAVPAWCGHVLTAGLAVLALEHGLQFIADIYRPRKGAAYSTAYESRLGGLLTDPASWVNNLAQAFDYQFGFNVSHTWFYRFLAGALLPLVLFQLAILYLLSCFVFIGPEEEGILERFGKPDESAGILDSGFHLKWPWPFETVRRFPSKRILDINIGARPDTDAPNGTPILWTQHAQANEDLFLVASSAEGESEGGDASVPVSLLNVHFPVEYRITNLFDYAYTFADPERALTELAYRSFSLQAAGSDLFSILATGQEKAVARLRADLQEAANRLNLGIEIVFVGLQGVHPPAAVVPAFESVIGASEEKEAIILQARTYAAGVAPVARARSRAVELEAEAYRFSRAALAEAEIDRYKEQIKGFEASSEVYMTRWYLRTLRDAIAGTRKFIVASDGAREILQFNFEEAINPDLFDLASPESTGYSP